jgi:hypothetical protein
MPHVFALLLTALLALAPLAHARADDPDANRATIEASMAAHPDDAALQESARRALEALDAWEATLRAARSSAAPAADPGPPTDGTVVGLPALPNPMEGLDSWDVNENWIGASIARQDWTLDGLFEGTVGSIDARYSFHRSTRERIVSDCDCNPPPPAPFQTIGTVRASALWGEDGLERGHLGIVGWSLQRNFLAPISGWAALRDTLEVGGLVYGEDDALGLDAYTEITLARAGRTWGWRPEGRSLLVMAGFGVSAGWAWADSVDETYNAVNNPLVGSWVTLGVARPGWGKLYIEQRALNGFQFSSPSAGGSTSREARFRFGFIKKLSGCLSLEAFIDKRSFNFSDHRLPDLYTKAKRTGLKLGCSW